MRNIIPANFEIERSGFLPILRVTGIIVQLPESERILLRKTVELINIFEKYRGRLMEPDRPMNMPKCSKNTVLVRFYIIFKDEKDLSEALLKARKEFG